MTPVTAKNITVHPILQKEIDLSLVKPAPAKTAQRAPLVPNSPLMPDSMKGGGSTGGGGASAPKAAPSAAKLQAAKDTKERKNLQGGIRLTAQELQAAFDAIFGNLDTLLKSRAGEIESGYGEKFNQIASDFAASLPQIEGSYAALGADSSTDLRDANIKADEGFKKANKELETNKQGDLAKVGQYGIEQKAKYAADRDSVNRVASRVGEVQDLGELRQTRNDFENKLGSVRADVGTLNTDEGARGQLSALTGDAGRFDSVKNALDSIVKGSMSGAVKEAAVKAVADSAGLSDDDKKKIQAQYGNTFAEQATL